MTRMMVSLAAAVAVLLASGCLEAPSDGGSDTVTPGFDPSSEEAPVLSVGDHWVQRAYREDAPDQTLGTIEYHMAAVETIETSGGPMEAYRIDVRPDNRSIWLRTSDWAIVQLTFAGEASTIDPPCVASVWPLTIGTWEHACQRLGTTAHNTTGPFDGGFESRVERDGFASVPAGEFDTTQVVSTQVSGSDNVTVTESFAPEACFPAKVEIQDANGTLVLDLLTFECARGA